MVSAKGKPTDPKLKEKVTEGASPLFQNFAHLLMTNSEVKNQPNKDGSGKGQMAAWKAAKIGKEYEKRGGDYENEPGSKNKPQKGPPEKKSDSEKKAETKVSMNLEFSVPLDTDENSSTGSFALEVFDGFISKPTAMLLRPSKGIPKSFKKVQKVLVERGSIPGSMHIPRNSSPLKQRRNWSDSSTQNSSDKDEKDDKEETNGAKAGKSEKKAGRPKGSGGAAKKKETKEPKKGERSSARQKGKSADENGEGKANTGKKRKSEAGTEPAPKKSKA